MDYLDERQSKILSCFDEQPSLSVREIQTKTGIPSATLYRDVRQMMDAGLLWKERCRLIQNRSLLEKRTPESCVHCGAAISASPEFSIQMEDGSQAVACCAHCGLMFLESQPSVKSALAADFLYRKMINVRQATFLLESQVSPCCNPSVLVFANQDQAERFQSGFGGRVLEYDAARQEVVRLMSLMDPPDHH